MAAKKTAANPVPQRPMMLGRAQGAVNAAQGAPVKPGAHVPQAPASKPGAPKAAPVAPVDGAALLAKIAELQGTVAKLTAANAKAAVNVRAVDAILDAQIDELPADDWRVTNNLHGATIRIKQFSQNPKSGNLELYRQDDAPPVACLLAVPTEDDIGGEGARARATGQIAVYTARRRDGSYEGAPSYVYPAELTAIWAD